MITKILFTAAVIAVVYLFASSRNRGTSVTREPKALPAASRDSKAPAAGNERVPRYLAYALLGLMLAGSGLFIFLEWRDQYQVVNVRVINSDTGSSVTYRARLGDVKDRSLETIDGRRVVLAAVERLVVGEKPEPGQRQ